MEIGKPEIRSVALRNTTPLDALYDLNPEIATLAYAHREKLLSPQILPYVARFRELQSDERIATIGALVEKLKIETGAEVAKYGVDGQVEMTRLSEDGLTTRTGIVQDGLTKRTKMESEVKFDYQKKMHELGMHHLDSQVEMTRFSEDGLTRREEIRMNGLRDLQKLKYDANVRMLQSHIDGQKYLSDNQLKATHVEAEAYKQAMQTRESIRAETERRVSKDRLEEKIKTAAIEFVGKIREAEIMRESNRTKVMSEVTQVYIEKQAELYLATIESELRTEAMQGEIEKERIKAGTERYSSFQETIRNVIDNAAEILKQIPNLSKESNIRFIVKTGEHPIEIRYTKHEDND